MPRAEGSTRAVPRWLVGVFCVSLAGWGTAAGLERASPPVLQSRVKWVPLAQVPADERPVLYVFTADWCAPCQDQDATFQDEALTEAIHRRVIPVRLVDRTHEDGENAAELAALIKRYEVTGFPTLVIQPREGNPLILRGFQRTDVLLGFVDR